MRAQGVRLRPGAYADGISPGSGAYADSIGLNLGAVADGISQRGFTQHSAFPHRCSPSPGRALCPWPEGGPLLALLAAAGMRLPWCMPIDA